ncbi:bifunctional transcriptional activator/DNA repair enzyme protein Ada [Sphingorhabdus lutea]|uniref:methylated-DNA--[protein]-cysteine S-methyltransferase n=1 Tax=Sphingorhabdus lutea TaxID=1913578 RepID=A0A1L3JCZ7_9SPHN|nr:methylated-DNA--[protein]-cysteine S-methyltransferase [Sphingorhabdus lutea]APG63027.1 bifunctional transcriptional activator/DNA repair enzyme protein Ada [Sphingorhabdus lutea]
MTDKIKIDDAMAWNAMLKRDRAFDGKFVTGVMSTGIYCRPSCAARHPARKNVTFFVNGQAAQKFGLRACKRCLPDDVARDEAAIIKALKYIDAENNIRLEDIAQKVGYAPHHFQRLFKKFMGVSPAAYARALKSGRAMEHLQNAQKISEAIYDAGYESASRFYDAMKGRLGMAPNIWKNGGEGTEIYWANVQTSLGNMLVAASAKGVCRLSFNEGEEELRAYFPKAMLSNGGDAFHSLLQNVIKKVEQPKINIDIPLDVKGTAFQEAVWQELQKIPLGETRSYAEIAAAIGRPNAVRATGSANGANNVAVLIPCHRVVRSDGSLGGYAYGLQIKQKLLDKESDNLLL